MRVASVVALLVASCLVASCESAKLKDFFFGVPGSQGPAISHIHNQGTQPLPQGFVSGQRFVPPTFDPSQDGASHQGSISFDANAVAAAAAGVEIPGCTLHTTTIEVTQTVQHPVSVINVVTATSTQIIPTVVSQYITSTHTHTLTQFLDRLVVSTQYSTIRQQVVQTKFPEPVTLISTHTKIATSIANSVVTRTLIDTVISAVTSYYTTTNVQLSTSTVFVPVTSTSYISARSVALTLYNTKTVTRTVDNYLPPQISYVRDTVRSTAVIDRTQRLNPETIASSTTVFSPIYSTITTTSLGIRTRSVWSTYEVVQTKTVTDVSTLIRVGVARQTEYSQVVSTVSQINYFTATSPVYITTSVTQDIPVTSTRSTTVLLPEYVVSTLPGQLITNVFTQTSHVQIVSTVTNTLSTPIVYATQTQYQNCPSHLTTVLKSQTPAN